MQFEDSHNNEKVLWGLLATRYNNAISRIVEDGNIIGLKFKQKTGTEHFSLIKNSIMVAIRLFSKTEQDTGLAPTMTNIVRLTKYTTLQVKDTLALMADQKYIVIEYGSPTKFYCNPEIVKRVEDGETFIKI